jgi:hypothetical protein
MFGKNFVNILNGNSILQEDKIYLVFLYPII